MKSNIFFISLAFLLLISNTALSQTDEEKIEEIIVESTRLEQPLLNIPTAISIISKKEIEQGRQQINIDEALSRVPGLFIQNRYNFAQDLRISIRGFGSRSSFGIRGIKILVDGIPETLPDGQGQVDSIDFNSLKQIEIIRSPSSSLHGNASGGIINFISDDSIEPIILTKFISGIDGYDKKQIKIKNNYKNINYSLGLAETNYQGYREHSESKNKQFSMRMNLNFSDNKTLIASFNHTNQPLSKDPGGINILQVESNRRQARDKNILFDAGEELKNSKIGLSLNYPINSYHLIKANIFNISRSFKNKLPFNNGGSVDLSRSFYGGGFSYTFSKENSFNNRLIIGTDFENQNDERKRFNNFNGILDSISFNQKETVKINGLFIRDEFTINNFDINLGLRSDIISFNINDYYLSNGNDSGVRNLNHTSPSLGILYNITNDSKIFTNFSTSFQTPTTTEFANPAGTGGFNPKLGPQSSDNMEIGFRSSGENHNYEIVIFKTKTTDEILPYELENSPGRNFFHNIGKSSRKGLELSSMYSVSEEVSINSSYTFSSFKFKHFIDKNNNFSGNFIPGIPKNMFYTELLYENSSNFFASIDFHHIGKIFTNNKNAISTKGYNLSNIRIGLEYNLADFIINPFLGISNIFDEDYNSNIRINAFGNRYYEPGPGQSIYFGISVSSLFK